MIPVPQSVPIKLWHEHLMQRIDEFADMNEATSARKMYADGMSVKQVARLILAYRADKGLAN